MWWFFLNLTNQQVKSDQLIFDSLSFPSEPPLLQFALPYDLQMQPVHQKPNQTGLANQFIQHADSAGVRLPGLGPL